MPPRPGGWAAQHLFTQFKYCSLSVRPGHWGTSHRKQSCFSINIIIPSILSVQAKIHSKMFYQLILLK